MQDDPQAEQRHWEMIALWLASLTLITAGTACFTALYNPTDPDPWRIGTLVLATSAAVASATAFLLTAAVLTSTPENARARAHNVMFAFMANAFLMVATVMVRTTQSIIQALGA